MPSYNFYYVSENFCNNLIIYGNITFSLEDPTIKTCIKESERLKKKLKLKKAKFIKILIYQDTKMLFEADL